MSNSPQMTNVEPRPAAISVGDWLPIVARCAIVAAQVATVLITWPLWEARAWPPLLPACGVPQCSMGWPMMVSALAVLIVPRGGLAVHASVVLVAMLMDQTRMQPEIVSHCLLLLGTLPAAVPRFVGRLHLISLWLFSGIHKLFSEAFYTDVAPFMWHGIFPEAPTAVITAFGVTVAVTEILLGVLSTFAATRRAAAVVGALFHVGVFLGLSLGLEWNMAVWPWNLALAVAAIGLLYPWRGSLLGQFQAVTLSWRAVGAALLLAPASYYIGGLDAYLAHCLYSANTPRGLWMHGNEIDDLSMLTIESLDVPMPPTHRTFLAFFRAAGRPGDRLTIIDPRPCARWWSWQERTYDYPAQPSP
ncbi:MAG TPA: hypothetical protein VG713_11340 [Pirellulales bacterium]|nr:hypothetical protein [Pirellulales bacterium]